MESIESLVREFGCGLGLKPDRQTYAAAVFTFAFRLAPRCFHPSLAISPTSSCP